MHDATPFLFYLWEEKMTKKTIKLCHRGFAVVALIFLTASIWGNASDDLFKSVIDCDIEKAKSLISAGADVNTRGERGMTPLMMACNRGNTGCSIDMVILLVENGADLDAKIPDDGTTALMLAAHFGELEKVKYLVSKGAKINVMTKGSPNWSSFNAVILSGIWAGVSDDVSCLGFLLDNGGNINVTNDRKESLLMIMVEMVEDKEDNHFYNVVKFLLEKGVKVNHKSNYGDTALFTAVDYDNVKVAELLLKYGAKPNYRNKGMETPLSIAKKKNNKELVQLLQKFGAKK